MTIHGTAVTDTQPRPVPSNSTTQRGRRIRTGIAVVSASAIGLLGLSTFAAPAGAEAGPSDEPQSVVFDEPGTYDVVVPAKVTTARVAAHGASGGAGAEPGGMGGTSAATITVTPGETLQINVGGRGAEGGNHPGGFNGGGASRQNICGGAGSGGGASDVRQNGIDLDDRVVVAGGGGGGAVTGHGAGAGKGGDGGGSRPTKGGVASGGGPGTSSVGGLAGQGIPPGEDGTFGVGGRGADYHCSTTGAGGGGWYGGGSGGFDGTPASAGGGGGGSGYAIPSATDVVWGNGTNLGDGSVSIAWLRPTKPAPATPKPPAKPKPAAPKIVCPSPKAPLRVYPNRPSVLLAAHLIDNCGYKARGLVAGGQPITALDPPAESKCPAWRPFRVYGNQPSLTIAAYLVKNCGFRIQWQQNRGLRTPYVVPHGWTPGAKVSL